GHRKRKETRCGQAYRREQRQPAKNDEKTAHKVQAEAAFAIEHLQSFIEREEQGGLVVIEKIDRELAAFIKTVWRKAKLMKRIRRKTQRPQRNYFIAAGRANQPLANISACGVRLGGIELHTQEERFVAKKVFAQSEVDDPASQVA